MGQNEKLASGVRILGAMFGTVALWIITFAIASRMLRHPSSSAKLRAMAVIIGVLGFIPWQVAAAKVIRMQDEFTRRIHLIAFSISFAATGLFIFTVALLQRAGFVDYINLMTIWFVMLGTWGFAVVGTEWYYRR